MAYLLDSNLVIPYLADDPATVPLVERLASQGIAISIITYLEVYQGTLRSPDPQLAQEQFERFLAVVPTLPRSLAVAWFTMDGLAQVWLFILAPLVGGVLGALLDRGEDDIAGAIGVAVDTVDDRI